MVTRESPKEKKVSLFITCLADLISPETGWSVVALLEHLDVEVDFPENQTCCGQPAFNAGHRPEARAVAIQFLQAFADAEVVVAPSGSCTAMVRHEYPKLFVGDAKWEATANRLASITWEITEFIVDGLGITNLNLPSIETKSVAVHDSCHGLRMLNLGEQGRKLLSGIPGVEVHDLKEHDVCCGFGGLFSVKMSAISGEMLSRKMTHIEHEDTETIVCGDISCLMHMNGGLEKQGSNKQVRHIVDVLAEGLVGNEI